MSTMELTKEQIFDFVRKMPTEQKREMLVMLANDESIERDRRQELAEQRLRQACAARGLNWDEMIPSERESFIDDLVHEDRPCAR